MDGPGRHSRWARHFVYRVERTRTTWKVRVGFVALIMLLLWLAGGWLATVIARGLICDASVAPSDAILVETFDFDYRLFERAQELRSGGLAPRVLVSLAIDPATHQPSEIAVGVTKLMATLSGLGMVEIVPVREIEPITLNAIRDVQRFLEREQIGSVIVVNSLFRSRRSALVYAATLGRAGIAVRYQPVAGAIGVQDWTRSWHGIQDVLEQWLKLQYYRLYVLPVNRAEQSTTGRALSMCDLISKGRAAVPASSCPPSLC